VEEDERVALARDLHDGLFTPARAAAAAPLVARARTRGMTSLANMCMFLTAFHSGMSPCWRTISMRLHWASSAQCESVSATVSGEPQMMRPIDTMSSHVARVPSDSAADCARRRNSLRDT
jgi:hypothetical protein